jgi:hypothetical protein
MIDGSPVKSTSEILREHYPGTARTPNVPGATEDNFHLKDGLKAVEPPVDFTPMATIAPSLSPRRLDNSHAEEPNHFEVLKQVERVTASKHFRNSKRYPALLKFVVEHALAGRMDVLKERTLGIEVFGRSNDYDTNADPVVRVTAGEIRKRIAQYYQADGHDHELRIELPVGSYVPQFSWPSNGHGVIESRSMEMEELGPSLDVHDGLTDAIPIPEEITQHPPLQTARKRSFRQLSIGALLLLGLIAAGATLGINAWRARQSRKGVDYIWKPVLAGDSPALIAIGVHSLDASGKDLSPETHVSSPSEAAGNMLSSMIRSDMVPVSDIVSYSQITKLLTERGRTYRTQGYSGTTFEELQRGPVILVGGFDNLWTLRLTSTLRYRFETPEALVGVIVDSERPTTKWTFDNGQSAVGNSRDYAIVASFFDPRIQQHVVIAAGIGKSGTAAAADFLTTNSYLQAWLSRTKVSNNKNVEIVLSTEIVEGQQGPPQVVASFTW